MIDYNNKKLLKELKNIYDDTLKRSYLRMGNGFCGDDFPYSPKYPNYFKKKILDNLVSEMREDVYEAYKNGAGHELNEGKNGVPPKFLSIASSSQFCFITLNVDECINEEEGADYFAHEGERIDKTYFEKLLPVLDNDKSTPPHMDAYALTEKREYFFECKCHEMFDVHSLYLSKNYFNTGKDLVVDYIPQEFINRGYIDPTIFGVGATPFDIKQLLTHLMGIKCNKKTEECDLIYYYCFPPKKDIKDERLSEVMDQVLKDAKTIFNSKIIKDYCAKYKINLRLCVKTFDPYAANKDNTLEVL